MKNRFTLPSFGKINLILRVLGRRRDGFHSIETIFQTIDLHDKLIFQFSPAQKFHVVLDIDQSDIPADSSNLIYKACRAFDQICPIRDKVEIRIEKNIPVESGLGGGSSNAACTLVALSRYYEWPVNPRKLSVIARKLGADVPFFLYGGTAMGTLRGDKIYCMDDWPSCLVLVVHPKIRCSTAEIYRKFDEAGLLTQRRNSIKILRDQRPESLRDIVSHIENDLEKVVFALYPELDSIKKRLIELGAMAAALTGSGSAVFGLFSEASGLERAARSFPASIKTRFLTREEYKTRLKVR